MQRCFWGIVLFVLLVQGNLYGQENLVITVKGGKNDGQSVPVRVPLSLNKDVADRGQVLLAHDKQVLTGQLTAPALTTEDVPAKAGQVRRDLYFVVPKLKAGESLDLVLDFSRKAEGKGFFWVKEKDSFAELRLAGTGPEGRPILRYMHAPYDDSTKAKRDLTFKVFHHLYDPAGTRFVTNGGPTGLFPHHRGIMFGFNRTSYGEGKKADTWHCPAPVHVAHQQFLNEEAGPVVGRHRSLVDWHGNKDTVFAKEERELTVYNIPGGTLVEFAARLKTTGGKVKLDGDPQHAGFQFRVSKEIDEKKTNKLTYYLRPDGKGGPGQTRNWSPKSKDATVDLPWDAMSFVLGDKRYTVCYLNHPRNPRESRFSERDYGRFGCYFEYEVTEDHPLLVNYRLWLQDGEMEGAQVQALADQFVAPPAVVVK